MSHSKSTPSAQRNQDLESEVPDPKVVPKAQRRQFSVQYKLRILEEASHCSEPGQIGALLRREGLYSSHLSKWRRQKARGYLQDQAPPKRGRKPADPAIAELERLRRENERLRTQLTQAELIIDVQKKLAQLLGLNLDQTESNEPKP
jgi:transposase